MDQQYALRPVPGRFLEFIVKPAVGRHGAALEHGGILGGKPRIVREHHHGLAANVEIRIIVPGILRRDDAVADEYQVAMHDFDFRHRALGPEHHVLAERQIAAAARPDQRQRARGACRYLHQRHLLDEARAIARL